MITFTDVRVDAGTTPVLHPTTLELTDPSTALVGPNGSGKSTFLRLINGLVLPTSGHVRVDGLDPEHEVAAVRRRVGFVFTDPDAQLVMPTAVEDVALSLRRLGVPRAEREPRARALLAAQGLAARADAGVRELSSGQRQLLALTSVLATEPTVLVCDEPTTLLDLHHSRRVAQVLLGSGAQLVVATHDLDLAAACHRALWVQDGRVHRDGPASDVVAAYRASV